MENEEVNEREPLGGQMSFLEHLDEFRRRLVKSVVAVGVAFIFCFIVSDYIFNFLAIPIRRALTEAQRLEVPVQGLTGDEKLLRLDNLKEGDKGRFVFNKATNLGESAIPPGTSVKAIVVEDGDGELALYTDETIYVGSAVIPKGIKLNADFSDVAVGESDTDEKLVFTKATEPFQLKVMVSLYGAIALAIPFLLLQVWGFISPALYKHERRYVTPFILLSSISFVFGAAFAYYILFPPAVGYLLGLGENFTPLLKATDYFDFIVLIMLAMGVIFQMPAVAYVLSRIGIISAGFLVRSWKIALILMLIVAAFVSPTGDVLNLMLFATPMMALYVVSILVAWIFGKKRAADDGEI